MSYLMLDVDQAGELKAAFRRANYTNAEIKKLSEGSFLAEVHNVLLGSAKILHLIDCDANPFVPNGWDVVEHQKGGKFFWDKEKQSHALYVPSPQKDGNGNRVKGGKLRVGLAGKPVLNVCVLDYLLEHPFLIPENWGGCINFSCWGTIYHTQHGDLAVRCLDRVCGQWRWDHQRIEYDSIVYNSAVLLAA